MSWAGQHLKAVDVDAYGSYRFVLVRVNDRTNAHRLLVRGKNGTGVEDLMREIVTEVGLSGGTKACMHTLTIISTLAVARAAYRETCINTERSANTVENHIT